VFDVHTMLAFATIFVLGVQGLGLAVIARSYAAHLGLLAQSQRLLRVLMRMSLERGLVLGGLLLLAGAACFVVALTTWSAAGFGPSMWRSRCACRSSARCSPSPGPRS
jgi:type IV secretory pathway TrbD component